MTPDIETATSKVQRKPIKAWLTDMDGVLVRENRAIPGAQDFITALKEHDLPFLVLTNNSIFTNRDLSARLAKSGLDVPETNIWTSANATAAFLASQSPGSSAFVIGEAGLTTAMHQADFVMTDVEPEYVVLGETRTLGFQTIATAVRLIEGGAKFIATNPDVSGPSDEGTMPATGALAAMIGAASGRAPYFVGKPNPIMIRAGLRRLGVHSESAAMIGDRMDTDVLAGVEAGLTTHLVLTGSTKLEDVTLFPYRPAFIEESIADIVPQVGK